MFPPKCFEYEHAKEAIFTYCTCKDTLLQIYIYIYIFYKTAKKVAVVYSQKEYKIIFTCCFVFI